MNFYVDMLVAVAWFAIFAMLLWGVADGLRKVLWNPEPLPFFRMLERQGLTLRQVEEAAGIGPLSLAVRRCAHCSERKACQAGFVSGWLGRKPVDCPNEELFRQAKG